MTGSEIDRLLAREINRAQLLKGGLAAAVGASSIVALGACGGSDSPASGTGAATTGGAKVTELVVAQTGAVTNLDPTGPSSIDPPTAQVLIACYERLVNVPVPADEGKLESARAEGFPPEPGFADSWDVSRDGREVVFRLRADVQSAYGNVLGADDVLWTMERVFAARGLGAFLLTLSGLEGPRSVSAVDDHTVRFRLTAPSPYFLQVVGLQYYPIYDSVETKRHATAKDPYAARWLATNVPGTGPYELKGIERGGTTTRLVSRSSYNGPRPATIPTVTQQAVDDNNSRLTLLLTGRSDFSAQLTPRQLVRVESSDTAQVTRFPATRGMYIVMNNTTRPFDDPAIRRALAQAIPYDAIITSAYAGHADRWKTLISPFLEGATDEFWTIETDPDAARAALAPLAGQSLALVFPQSSSAGEQVAVAVQSALAKIGVEISVEKVSDSVYNERKIAGELAFALNDTDTPIIPSTFYNLRMFFTSRALLNYSRYSSRTFDATVDALFAAYARGDADAQQSLIERSQQILVEDMPIIPVAYTGSPQGYARDITIQGAACATGATFNYRDFAAA